MKVRQPCATNTWGVWGSAAILTLCNLGCDDKGTTPSVNRAPEAAGEIPAQVVVVETRVVIDLSDYFTDPDGDTLAYSATVSDSRIARVSVLTSSLGVTGVALGAAIVTVTATDAGGLAATQSFDLIVRTLPSPDRGALVALHEATGGEEWTTNTGWMSHAPIGEWFGVETDEEGRVTALHLRYNGLTGHLPPALGDLSRLTSLDLSVNYDLGGPIPAEMSRLSRLTVLDLSVTVLEGPLPRELARLPNLAELNLRWTGLRGPIPPELGKLANLEVLDLSWTTLSDTIPPEFGNLANLRILNLEQAGIQGRIPVELGNLVSLEELVLADNVFLFGRIPPELGNLSTLVKLDLSDTGLMGPIPVEIGNLAELRTLDLQGNAFMDSLPAELGRLGKLRQLYLSRTPLLQGALPHTLTELRSLEALVAHQTAICAPADAHFTRWLEGIPKRRVQPCSHTDHRAYLMQAVQSRSYPVPLVAGSRLCCGSSRFRTPIRRSLFPRSARPSFRKAAPKRT